MKVVFGWFAAAAAKRRRCTCPPFRALAAVGLAFSLAGLTKHGALRAAKGPTVDIDTVLWMFLMFGVGLRGSAVACDGAVNEAARQVGSMILLYPIYGGIMGILDGTGLINELGLAGSPS